MSHVFAILFSAFAWATPAHAAIAKPDPAAVARIHKGPTDCVDCQLQGADLTNTCVKAHDLHGADFDGANATLMCMSYANFDGASFVGTNLSGANLAHAKLAGANFANANLNITSFKGTDLTKAKGLTQAQLDKACGDKDTKAPAGLHVPICS